jgi:hypothetical protein
MSVTLIYGPRSVFDCESAFDELEPITYVTHTADSTYRKWGLYSSKFAITDSFTTGIVGTRAISAMNLSAATSIRFWIRSQDNLDANDLQFLIDDDEECANGNSHLVTVDINETLTADTWKQVTLTLPSMTALTAVISIGLKVAVSKSLNMEIYLDKIEIATTSKTFNELHIAGFDNPENEEGFPQSEVEQLLDGSHYKTPTVATTRNISIDLGVLQDSADQLFLREFAFASTQQVTYDNETLDVISTVNSFPVDRVNNTITSKHYSLELKEKTARLLGSALPSSWTN